MMQMAFARPLGDFQVFTETDEQLLGRHVSFKKGACGGASVAKAMLHRPTHLLAIALALLVGSAAGCSSNDGNINDGDTKCAVCPTSCSNGLVTIGLVLDPPGCGSQCSTQFCPGGCSSDGKTCLGFTVADGGEGSCVASQLTATQGLLKSGGVAVSRGTTIILATSAALACELTGDAGTEAQYPSAAALIIDFPPGFAGTATASSGSQLAVLTAWSAVGPERTPATSGSVEVNLSQPGGGLIGTYSLQFGADAELGSFTAPECDVCVTPP